MRLSDEVLEASSLGGPAAQALGEYVSEEEVDQVLRLVHPEI
jgi:hypothetical protein